MNGCEGAEVLYEEKMPQREDNPVPSCANGNEGTGKTTSIRREWCQLPAAGSCLVATMTVLALSRNVEAHRGRHTVTLVNGDMLPTGDAGHDNDRRGLGMIGNRADIGTDDDKR